MLCLKTRSDIRIYREMDWIGTGDFVSSVP
nr:MAG TPA: hypothetical protein [Caudoviricetes sp.]